MVKAFLKKGCYKGKIKLPGLSISTKNYLKND